MEKTGWLSLLKADEERLQNTLRANDTVEKDRDKSIALLSGELGEALLRYNAACAPDRMRQALADCLAATARDTLALLKAGGAEKEVARRESSGWAMLCLLLAVVAAAAGVLLYETSRLAAMLCVAGAVVLAFLAGRFWFRERAVSVRATLDPETLWRGMLRTGETMDRKIDAFCERSAEWLPAPEKDGAALGEAELRLFGDLLEALYAENGDFALRQLAQVKPCLRALGVETEDYSAESAAHFELFPSRRPGVTLRPALLAGGKLLLPGRATEQTETGRR